MTSMLVMAKTPFPRKHSGSVDEDESGEDFDDVFSPPPPQSTLFDITRFLSHDQN